MEGETQAAAPVFEQLEQAHEALADLLAEIDDLQLQGIPRVKADYQVKIGCWELRVQKAELAARRAKRKCELAQRMANDGREVDEARCEEMLDAEFAEWLERVREAASSYKAAVKRRSGGSFLSKADSEKLKRLHRILVKRLHPDISRAKDAGECARLLELAQGAYKTGDVALLESLEVSTRDLEREDGPRTPEEAAVELALVEAHMSVLSEKKAQLEEGFPWNMRAKLADPAWVARRSAELKEQVDGFAETEKRYLQRFGELRGGRR